MPEGVEVKISSELIKPLLVGKYVGKIYVGSNGRYSNKDPEGLKEFNDSFRTVTDSICMVDPLVHITDVNTKGKFMYWSFDNDWYLFNTFGMTGQWSPEEGKHVCLKFRMHSKDPKENMTCMHFNDPRHFGTVKFVKGRQKLLEKLNELGWDPLNHGLNETWTNYVVGLCARKTKPIGELLMDQSIFAGVGNYIRAEALYLAKISPWRQANLMKKDEILSLCQALVDVMKESYAHQGATILTYKDAYGAEGKYSSCFKVYGQKKDPLGNTIMKQTTPEGRSIHWCPAIQV